MKLFGHLKGFCFNTEIYHQSDWKGKVMPGPSSQSVGKAKRKDYISVVHKWN